MATALSVVSDKSKRVVDIHRSINTSDEENDSHEFLKQRLQTFDRLIN